VYRVEHPDDNVMPLYPTSITPARLSVQRAISSRCLYTARDCASRHSPPSWTSFRIHRGRPQACVWQCRYADRVCRAVIIAQLGPWVTVLHQVPSPNNKLGCGLLMHLNCGWQLHAAHPR
jgi:hypothetical protein